MTELARFLKSLFQGVPAYELRCLVAYCFMMDIEKNGLVRPDELLQHLHAIPLKSPTGAGGAGGQGGCSGGLTLRAELGGGGGVPGPLHCLLQLRWPVVWHCVFAHDPKP